MDKSTLVNEQYRPVSTSETAVDDAASVRAARDIALGINNGFARACAPHLCDAWPYGTTGTIAHSANDTDEHVMGGMMRLPPVNVGATGHYTHACWSAYGFIGAASNNATLRLYSAEKYYRGPNDITATTLTLLGAYAVDSLAFTSADGEMQSSGDFALILHRDLRAETYFMLTVEFAAAAAGNALTLMHLAITLGRSELADIL